jgi:hypothetical protein
MNDHRLIPRSVWYGLDGKGYDNIAQELKCEDPKLRTWISVYAVYKYEISNNAHQYYDFINTSKPFRYCSIIFTIPTETIEISDGIDDRDITITELKQFNSEEDIHTYLYKKNIDPALFVPPWRCDYPL